LANNVSSGLEPVFRFAYQRRMRDADGGLRLHAVEDYAHALFRERFGDAGLPPAFVSVADIPPGAHLAMQAALQPYVDSAISKTINVPRDYPYAGFRSLYEDAYDQGLKGCTTFRPNAVTGEVLVDQPPTPPAVHCCSVEREAD
jgi:ribonucleoside-diphosphate reductase alpha chain